MRKWQCRMASGFLMSAVSALSVSQMRRVPQAATRTAGAISVFGALQSGTGMDVADAVPLRRLDGSLRGIVAAGLAGTPPTAASLRTLNPALHVRVAVPTTQAEVLVDVTAQSDPLALQRALESLGMRETARASNLIGGWLPVTSLAQAAQLAGLNQMRASMPRTRAATGPVALQGDFVQESSGVRSQYPSLTGSGLTVGVLSDSFDCYSYYATNGPSAIGNGYNGYATNGLSLIH